MPKRTPNLELGLQLLAARAPGVRHSLMEIAAWCGCSHQTIANIELRAMKKVRLRLLEKVNHEKDD